MEIQLLLIADIITHFDVEDRMKPPLGGGDGMNFKAKEHDNKPIDQIRVEAREIALRGISINKEVNRQLELIRMLMK